MTPAPPPPRARRHRLLVGSVMLLSLLLAATLGWLLLTTRGRDALLAQIVARLPAGTELTWDAADGPLSGPLTLRGVRFSMPRQRDPDCVPTPRARCAMGTLRFQAQTVVLDPALLPLLGGTLRLDALEVRGGVLDLPRSDTPLQLPRWPDVLPQIAPPLALRADAIRIDALAIQREGAPLLTIQRLRGGLQASAGRLHVEHLAIDSDRGRFTLHGDYQPARDFRSDLTATAVLAAAPGRTPARLGLVVRGDLKRMVVALAGDVPDPLRASLLLQGDKATPHWQLSARGDGLDLGLLAGAATPATPLRFSLSARGKGGDAQLQGALHQGERAFVLQPSRLRLQDQQLQLQPLVLDAFGGRITARGSADLRDPARASVQLALAARGLRWSDADGTTTLRGDADLGVSGQLQRWALQGQLRLLRGHERAEVELTGNGDLDRMQVTRLMASMPQGRLDASGALAWTPALEWTAQATLAGFDPGYFAPDWPGAIHGELRSRGGTRADGQLRAELQARDLGGRLRGRALAGHADATIDGDTYRGDLALSLGGSRIDAHGSMADTVAVTASLAPLRLDDLLPGGGGVLRGTLALRGARRAPDLAVNLTGRDLAFGAYRATHLQAQGRLPWQAGDGDLRLDASGVQAGLPLDSLHARLRGAVERLQLDAEARGEAGTLALSAQARRRGAGWQGALATLALGPARGGAWTLAQPAAWRWRGGAFALDPACLRGAAGGRVCAQGGWPQPGLRVQGDALPLALAADWLPPRSDGRPWALDGTLDLQADVRAAGRGWQATATLRSAAGGLRERPGARRALLRYRDLVVAADLGPAQWQLSAYAALGRDGSLAAQVQTGPQAQAPLRGVLRLRTTELLPLELLSPDIVEPRGRLDVAVQLGGSRAAPRLGGQAQLQGFAAELPALGIAVQDGELQLQAQEDGSARIAGTLGTGQGPLQVEGSLGWQDTSTPLQLSLRGTRVLLADTRQLRLLASPDIRLSYRAGAPLQVRGSVAVPQADVHLERLEMGVAPSPDVVVLDPADPQQAAASPLPLDLDLAVTVGNAVKLDGYGLAGTLGGSLRVRQLPGGEARATGALEVGGRYRAYGQDLRITRGRLLWSNSAIADPHLDIRAEREVGDVTAGVQVSGRALAPQASVWSNPAMSQSEALAYLTLGRPLPSLSRSELQQVDLAKSALNAGVGLLTAQLGARIGLDEAGVSTSRALGGEVLGVGKYLSPRLYVSYGVSLLGTGQVVTLKYLLRKGFDIQVESSTVENRASLNWRTEK
ncbi:translocation/assembly module TamB domain-containing protein [Thermomonas alba]|uniref:translocation/assembly module TamB domain-containing protein n=1 Tax=Thermomonas alba TaxID=2888525 RepID=UPI001F03C111|nr:translocation/assembly module TamB domain-containing protein [Thermomonas alba]